MLVICWIFLADWFMHQHVHQTHKRVDLVSLPCGTVILKNTHRQMHPQCIWWQSHLRSSVYICVHENELELRNALVDLNPKENFSLLKMKQKQEVCPPCSSYARSPSRGLQATQTWHGWALYTLLLEPEGRPEARIWPVDASLVWWVPGTPCHTDSQ